MNFQEFAIPTDKVQCRKWSSTDFLFPQPSVFYGIARLIDLGASLDSYNTSDSPEEADARAIYGDLHTVLGDFQAALENTLQEYSRESLRDKKQKATKEFVGE